MPKNLLLILLMLAGFQKIAFPQYFTGGARSAALANAVVSITDEWNTFHNQATLAALRNISLGFYYESKFTVDEFSLKAGTFVLPINSGTFGLSFYQFGEKDFKEHKIGLAFAKQLSAKLNAAVQFDYLTKHYPENGTPFSFVTFECGATYQANKNIILGAHVLNPLKNGFNFPSGIQKLPALYRIGGHYLFNHNVFVSLEIQKESDEKAIVKTGSEFLLFENFAIRFGVYGRPVQYTAGIGYQLKRLSTDFAFSYHDNLGFSPSVSIQYQLK